MSNQNTNMMADGIDLLADMLRANNDDRPNIEIELFIFRVFITTNRGRILSKSCAEFRVLGKSIKLTYEWITWLADFTKCNKQWYWIAIEPWKVHFIKVNDEQLTLDTSCAYKSIFLCCLHVKTPRANNITAIAITCMHSTSICIGYEKNSCKKCVDNRF